MPEFVGEMPDHSTFTAEKPADRKFEHESVANLMVEESEPVTSFEEIDVPSSPDLPHPETLPLSLTVVGVDVPALRSGGLKEMLPLRVEQRMPPAPFDPACGALANGGRLAAPAVADVPTTVRTPTASEHAATIRAGNSTGRRARAVDARVELVKWRRTVNLPPAVVRLLASGYATYRCTWIVFRT